MVKTDVNNPIATEAATAARGKPLTNTYAPHVTAVQYRGHCVRVYGSAVPGKDPVYEDTAGLFCSTHKFMNAVTQALTKFNKRQVTNKFHHVFVTTDGKHATGISGKGSERRAYVTKVQSGEGYVFETRGRDAFFNLINKDKSLCLLRMEAFTGRKGLVRDHGFTSAKIWSNTSEILASSCATVGEKKKSKHDKGVDRRAKKRREERERHLQFQKCVKPKPSFCTEQKAPAKEYCADKIGREKAEARSLVKRERLAHVIPPAPKVNPWAIQQKASVSVIGNKKENTNSCTDLEPQKSQPRQEELLLSPQNLSVFQGIEAPLLDENLLRSPVSFTIPSLEDRAFCARSDTTNDSNAWEEWGRSSTSSISSSEKSVVSSPCPSTCSSTCSSTSSAWLSITELLLDPDNKPALNKDAKSFYPTGKGELWLERWLAYEVKLKGDTLKQVCKAFLKEEMDSRSGLEYLSKTNLAEFKIELADLGVTKKGVLSKLRGAVERLFA